MNYQQKLLLLSLHNYKTPLDNSEDDQVICGPKLSSIRLPESDIVEPEINLTIDEIYNIIIHTILSSEHAADSYVYGVVMGVANVVNAHCEYHNKLDKNTNESSLSSDNIDKHPIVVENVVLLVAAITVLKVFCKDHQAELNEVITSTVNGNKISCLLGEEIGIEYMKDIMCYKKEYYNRDGEEIVKMNGRKYIILSNL